MNCLKRYWIALKDSQSPENIENSEKMVKIPKRWGKSWKDGEHPEMMVESMKGKEKLWKDRKLPEKIWFLNCVPNFHSLV